MEQSSRDEQILTALINNDIKALDYILGHIRYFRDFDKIVDILSNNLYRMPKTDDIVKLILDKEPVSLDEIYHAVVETQNTKLFKLFVKASKDNKRIKQLLDSLIYFYSFAFEEPNDWYTSDMKSHIKTCLFIALEELSDLISLRMIINIQADFDNYPELDCICYILFRSISEKKLNMENYRVLSSLLSMVASIDTPKDLVNMIISHLSEDQTRWVLSYVQFKEPQEGYVSLFSEDV